jgi:uncharacterized SAM-binding protein YcdF (DUF218 family)
MTTVVAPRRQRRAGLTVLAVVVVVLAVVAGHLFIWPKLPPVPAKADVIVQLGGPGDRRRKALELAREGRAPVVAISISTLEGRSDWCADGVLHGVRVICFHPEPFTTRGEARSIAQLAGQHHWHTVIVVTTTDHAWRALVRVRRCYSGTVSVATAHLPWYWWPIQIPYQFAATAKAFTYERSC